MLRWWENGGGRIETKDLFFIFLFFYFEIRVIRTGKGKIVRTKRNNCLRYFTFHF